MNHDRVSVGDVPSSVPGKWAAAVLYLGLTLLLTFPISLNPGSVLMSDDPDTHLFMWTLAWDAHAFLHQPLAIFDANIFSPNHATLAYSENLIGSAFFAAPILWLTGNPVLAVNAISLLSCVLCGLGAYVLARRLGLSASASLLCGVIFAFSPPRFLRFNQLHLTVVQWIPFSLASLHAYLDDGRRRDLHLAAGFFALQMLSSGHGAVFLIVAIAILLGYRIAMGERLAWRSHAGALAAPAGLLLMLAAALFMPYRMAQVEQGLIRGLGSWDTRPQSFIASPTHLDVFLLSLVTRFDPNATASAYLFPGYLPLLLALAALAWRGEPPRDDRDGRPRTTGWTWIASVLNVGAVASAAATAAILMSGPVRVRVATTLLTARSALRASIVTVALVGLRMAIARWLPFAPLVHLKARRRAWHHGFPRRWRNPVPVYLLMVLFSVAISLGPPLGLWPLVYSLPVLNFIRVPSRFMILGVLGVAVLAGIGFDRLSWRLAPRVRRASAAILGVLLVAEFAAIPLPAVPYRFDIPRADRWVAQQPKPFVVVEVPAGIPESDHSEYMLHAMAHWQKTVHGYSGFRPGRHAQLYDQLESFPSEESLRNLTTFGVTYVIVHRSLFPSAQLPRLDDGLRTFAPWLTVKYADPDTRVYSLHRP